MYGIVDNVVVVVWVCIDILVKQIIHFAVANFMSKVIQILPSRIYFDTSCYLIYRVFCTETHEIW